MKMLALVALCVIGGLLALWTPDYILMASILVYICLFFIVVLGMAMGLGGDRVHRSWPD
jgi:hypothetical protein